MTYASFSDLQGRFEGTIPASGEVAIMFKVAQAERVIAARLRQPIADAITAGRTTAEDVRDVVCEMVLRTVRNTGGVTAQTAGPFSQTFDAAVASGKLWLTRENRMQLGLTRLRSASAEIVDEVLPDVIRRRWLPERSNQWHPDDEMWGT